MVRLVDVDDLANGRQVARRCGLSPAQTVSTWEERHRELPPPSGEVGRGRLRPWSEVEARGRTSGRLVR